MDWSPVICIIALLNFVSATHKGDCKTLLFYGSDVIPDMLGKYHLMPLKFYGQPHWKHESKIWYLGRLLNPADNQLIWVVLYDIDAVPLVAYTINNDQVDHPEQISAITQVYDSQTSSVVTENVRFDCLNQGDYLSRPGVCVDTHDVISDLVVLGHMISQEDCKAVCDARADCGGYHISKTGCVPMTTPCYPPVAIPSNGYTYYKKLVTTFTVGKNAYQSSTLGTYDASLAVDGNPSGLLLTDRTCSHTRQESDPWWLVDLGSYVLVNELAIANRKDCCGDRLVGFHVNVTSMFNHVNLERGEEKICIRHSGVVEDRTIYPCSVPVAGRYIIITVPGENRILTLCEVEVFVTPVERYVSIQGIYRSKDGEQVCSHAVNGTQTRIDTEAEMTSVQNYLNRNQITYVSVHLGQKDHDGYQSRDAMSLRDGLLIRVSSLKRLGSCTASSSQSAGSECAKAIDDVATPNNAWISNNEGSGAWIKISLIREFTVARVRIMQRFCRCNSFKDVELEFSDGSTKEAKLEQRKGVNNEDTSGMVWDDIILQPPRNTSYVKITALSVSTIDYNGYNEIEIWAIPEKIGYHARQGACPGNTINTASLPIEYCEASCRSLSICVGFDFGIGSNNRDLCELKSATCAAPATDSTRLTFQYSDVTNATSWSMRKSDCMYPFHISTGPRTFETCRALCESQIMCLSFQFNFDQNQCFTMEHPCERYMPSSQDNSYKIVFEKRGRPPLPDNYVGCYWDGSPSEFTKIEENEFQEVSHCLGMCYGHKYAALKDGKKCYCGDRYGMYGMSLQCQKPCPGRDTDICGGPQAFSVWTTAPPMPEECNILSNFDHVTGMWTSSHLYTKSVSCDRAGHLLCETYYDPCSSRPCLYNGTCVAVYGEYNCTCTDGLTGPRCEINTDDCTNSTCQNGGTCVDQVNSYICLCGDGLSGTHCEADLDDCASSPCQNSGNCTDLINNFSCACPVGFTGDTCQTDINECSSSPCLHGSVCLDRVGFHQCQCLAGFTGPNCETDMDDCSSRPCYNNGTCIDRLDDFRCECPHGIVGERCETNVDECISNPCQNFGVCRDGVNGYTCDCHVGAAGTHCEIDVNECASNPCINNGACRNLDNRYECDCVPGYTGVQCQTYAGNPGIWGQWTSWSPCSRTCGTGARYRERSCDSLLGDILEPLCDGPDSQSDECQFPPCPPVDGAFGEWMTVGPCSATCGHGFAPARRTCDFPNPQYGGRNCSGKTESWIVCEMTSCEISSSDTSCSTWSTWGPCDAQCGVGIRSRSRTCKQNGNDVTVEQEEECVMTPCQVNKCHKCKTTVSDLRGGVDCALEEESCENEAACLHAFSMIDNQFHFSKRCARKTECTIPTDVNVTRSCKELFDLIGRKSLSFSGSSPLPVQKLDGLHRAWSELATSCNMCCSGSLCNSGVLPSRATLYVAGGASRQRSHVTPLLAPIVASFYIFAWAYIV